MDFSNQQKLITKTSSISFIIPAYNCEDTIAESIMSIIDGNLKEKDEIIIINDASTDNTLKIVEDLQKKYSIIKILSHKYNKGSAAASRNTGIENAVSELIFCLDADNVLIPNSIEKLLQTLIENNADAVAFGELWYFKDFMKTVTHKLVYLNKVELKDALAGVYWPGPSGNYLFTKTSWEKAGKYDESVGGAYDSWVFGIKQLAIGSLMLTVPNTHYFHRYGYESTFIRDSRKFNPSKIGTSTLQPFFNIIENKSIKYITSKKHKELWFESMEKHPILVKGEKSGKNGKLITYTTEEKQYTLARKIYRALKKILLNREEIEDIQTKRIRPWIKINGDDTLRLNYPLLNPSSVVIDVGGYHGDWANNIAKKYDPIVHIYEPIKDFSQKLSERFLTNPKIHCHPVGLSDVDAIININLKDDSSSLFKNEGQYESIEVVDTTKEIEKQGIVSIDLMKINIEGSEYELLENIIHSGYISNIKNIQVQFHDFVPNATKRMHKIWNELAKTHHLTYQYVFVWENWEINDK
ncbi:MAG: FkbM family methyltransferase [Patescibacteria group bacterium]